MLGRQDRLVVDDQDVRFLAHRSRSPWLAIVVLPSAAARLLRRPGRMSEVYHEGAAAWRRQRRKRSFNRTSNSLSGREGSLLAFLPCAGPHGPRRNGTDRSKPCIAQWSGVAPLCC